VLKCKVFEVVEQCAKEEAVRIFVQFTTITAATKPIKVRSLFTTIHITPPSRPPQRLSRCHYSLIPYRYSLTPYPFLSNTRTVARDDAALKQREAVLKEQAKKSKDYEKLQKDKAGAAKLAAERIKVRDGQRMKLQAEVQAVSAAVRFFIF
jgi:hypothetical protein